MTRKSITTSHAVVACDVCGRTLLRGEQAEVFITGGSRRMVCELCTPRAQHEGWIRESGADELALRQPRQEGRGRSLLERLRTGRRRAGGGENGREHEHQHNGHEPDAGHVAEDPAPPTPAPAPQPPRRPRHVRAVPTNAQVKVERAMEIFNSSDHVRTIGGIARTLGEPWVSAAPLAETPSEVSLVVAWELSWYQYRVDLGDAHDPVTLVAKGQELDELDETMREWNATALADGRLAVGVSAP